MLTKIIPNITTHHGKKRRQKTKKPEQKKSNASRSPYSSMYVVARSTLQLHRGRAGPSAGKRRPGRVLPPHHSHGGRHQRIGAHASGRVHIRAPSPAQCPPLLLRALRYTRYRSHGIDRPRPYKSSKYCAHSPCTNPLDAPHNMLSSAAYTPAAALSTNGIPAIGCCDAAARDS